MKSQIAAGVQFEPIARESVEQRVTQALRELIVGGQLEEGTPLVQRDLAQRLGVSQTPVRVGLSELEREGEVDGEFILRRPALRGEEPVASLEVARSGRPFGAEEADLVGRDAPLGRVLTSDFDGPHSVGIEGSWR